MEAGDRFLDGLAGWAADARVDEAASRRARQRWLQHQARDDASLRGLLVDLAERAATVVVGTAAGRRHRGTVAAVGRDFCAVRAAVDVLVPLSALAGVRAVGPGAEPATGNRTRTLDLELLDALALLAEELTHVQVLTRGDPEPIRGSLVSVGRDVATLRLDGGPGELVYVPVTSMLEVALPAPTDVRA